jgi:hypothetical protein
MNGADDAAGHDATCQTNSLDVISATIPLLLKCGASIIAIARLRFRSATMADVTAPMRQGVLAVVDQRIYRGLP